MSQSTIKTPSKSLSAASSVPYAPSGGLLLPTNVGGIGHESYRGF